MKKLVFSMLLLAGALSCVDSDYDLSQIDSDIQVGNDQSEFKLPLMTIAFNLDDLNEAGDDEVSMADLYAELDTWLPSNTSYIEVQRLSSDATYLQNVLKELCAEMGTSETKRNEVCTLIAVKHRTSFFDALADTDIDTTVLDTTSNTVDSLVDDDPEAAGQTIGTLFTNWRTEVEAAISQVAGHFMVDLDLDPVCYEVQPTGSMNDILDLLSEDVRIELYGTVNSSLPFAMNLNGDLDFKSNPQRFDLHIDRNGSQAINPLKITRADIAGLAEEVTEFRMNVLVDKYYPGTLNGTQEVVITLKLKVTGAFNF